MSSETDEPPNASDRSPPDVPAASMRPGTGAWRARGALLVALACLVGALAGIGGYTFFYAEGISYFSTEPAACVNCHIMRPQYDAWQKSSHHTVAVCIDCHLPHDFVAKYVAKAENGYRHSKEFTTQTFAEPIFVKERGRRILEDNCRYCHAALVSQTMAISDGPDDRVSCVQCHAGVGHGDAARLGGKLRQEEIQKVMSHE